MTFHYQKTEHDCWICALRNFLSFFNISVSEEEILDILQYKNNFPVFCNRGFFTYLPIILDDLNIKCDIVLDPRNRLVQEIMDYEHGYGKICSCCLDQIIQTYKQQKDALYYFYKALKSAALSPNITIRLDHPFVKEYLDWNYVVIACLTVSQLYGATGNEVLHSVTLKKEQGKILMIDPYEFLGKEEKNWMIWKENSLQYDWSQPIPYFIAAKVDE